jgi:hypothetical protein
MFDLLRSTNFTPMMIPAYIRLYGTRGLQDQIMSADRKPATAAWTRLLSVASAALFVAGLGASAYETYDLFFPNHFVGDMYGLEILMRVAILAAPAFLLILGGALCLARIARKARPGALGMTLLLIATTTLLAIAVNTSRSRQLSAARQGYPALSIQELVRIALEENDQYAVDALSEKGVHAVPPLRSMLLDQEERFNLRWCAAHALGRIGGDEAKSALREARSVIHNSELVTAIDYALDNARPATPETPRSN